MAKMPIFIEKDSPDHCPNDCPFQERCNLFNQKLQVSGYDRDSITIEACYKCVRMYYKNEEK